MNFQKDTHQYKEEYHFPNGQNYSFNFHNSQLFYLIILLENSFE